MEYLPSPELVMQGAVSTERDKELSELLDPLDAPMAYLEKVYVEEQVEEDEKSIEVTDNENELSSNSENASETKRKKRSKKRDKNKKLRDDKSSRIVLKKTQSNVMLNIKFRRKKESQRVKRRQQYKKSTTLSNLVDYPLSYFRGAQETLAKLYKRQYLLTVKILATIKREIDESNID